VAIQEQRHSYLINPYGLESTLPILQGAPPADKPDRYQSTMPRSSWPRRAAVRPGPGGAGGGWLVDKFGINWMVSIDKA